MKQVIQYPVEVKNGEFTIDLPVGARLLNVHAFAGRGFLYVLEDPDPEVERAPRRFCFAGTGSKIIENADALFYVGTVPVNDGSYAYHLFTEFV
jgi:hypothetical protein